MNQEIISKVRELKNMVHGEEKRAEKKAKKKSAKPAAQVIRSCQVMFCIAF